MKEIRTLTSRYTEAKELRIMMAGQIFAGTSSYINTIDSALQGHLSSRALAGVDEHRVTKKFNPFRVEDRANGEGDGFLPFVIYDNMGIDRDVDSPDDYISAVKGHIKDGYKFNPIRPLRDGSPYFNKNPTVNDVAHCLVYVVAAHRLRTMDDHVLKFLKHIRSNVSDIDIPQIVLVTKVDAGCPLVEKDLKKVYRSRYIKQQVSLHLAAVGFKIK
ncbi:IF44L protein, partial [Atractosteus spatula]|nr:IF44L protein [Atractosteus spatula]